ncbi:MAG: CinA family nicotinamide mononucleotide deamidase-related protein [Myxococcota bacterium]
MTKSARAAFVAIGDELMSGAIEDGNGDHVRAFLEARGIELVERRLVPDDEAAIRRTVTELSGRADWLITTGGLGPTLDDRTHRAVAGALGRDLVVDEEAARRIQERLSARGRTATPAQLQMAAVPEGAVVLVNEVGAAPGSMTRHDGCLVCVLPGVPGEMRVMLEQLEAHLPRNSSVRRRELSVFGQSESEVDGLITPVLSAQTRYGIRNDGLVNHVRLSSRDGANLDADVEAAASKLGDGLFARDGAALEAVLGERLAANGATLAVAESCTGGWIAQTLTATPGSSRYVLGGVVAYANEVKSGLLGVPASVLERHGAVSEEVALAMAKGVRTRLGASWGVSTTGVAGPGGGSPEKPVGTVWIAWADEAGATARRLSLPPERRDLIRWLTVQAVLGGLLERLPKI